MARKQIHRMNDSELLEYRIYLERRERRVRRQLREINISESTTEEQAVERRRIRKGLFDILTDCANKYKEISKYESD